MSKCSADDVSSTLFMNVGFEPIPMAFLCNDTWGQSHIADARIRPEKQMYLIMACIDTTKMNPEGLVSSL